MQHKWVRHSLVEIEVDPPNIWGMFNCRAIKEPQITMGCDNCGLPLTRQLYEEECLGELEDQMEDEGSEELDGT